jgi:hypothetical protein
MADLTKEAYWNLVEALAEGITDAAIEDSEYEQDAIELANSLVDERVNTEFGQNGWFHTYDKQLQVLRWTGERDAIFDRGHGIRGRSAADIVKEIAEMAFTVDLEHALDGDAFRIEDAFSEEEDEDY